MRASLRRVMRILVERSLEPGIPWRVFPQPARSFQQQWHHDENDTSYDQDLRDQEMLHDCSLLDHLIGSQQQRRGIVRARAFGCLEVDTDSNLMNCSIGGDRQAWNSTSSLSPIRPQAAHIADRIKAGVYPEVHSAYASCLSAIGPPVPREELTAPIVSVAHRLLQPSALLSCQSCASIRRHIAECTAILDTDAQWPAAVRE